MDSLGRKAWSLDTTWNNIGLWINVLRSNHWVLLCMMANVAMMWDRLRLGL